MNDTQRKKRISWVAIVLIALVVAALPFLLIALMIVERTVFGTFFVERTADRLGLLGLLVTILNALGLNG